jgi:hypothetical protein
MDTRSRISFETLARLAGQDLHAGLWLPSARVVAVAIENRGPHVDADGFLCAHLSSPRIAGDPGIAVRVSCVRVWFVPERRGCVRFVLGAGAAKAVKPRLLEFSREQKAA